MSVRVRFLLYALTVVGLIAGALSATGTMQDGAAAEQRTTIAMLEWPTGYGPPEQAVILSRLITEDSNKIRLSAQETPGYVYNLKVMARDEWRWARHIFGTNPGARWLAENAIEPFFNEPITQEWKLLWGEAISLNGNFVTLDPNIKSPADFKGKRVALGLQTQTNWGGFTTVILEHGFGITKENTELQYLGPRAAMDALLDGRVDVAVYGTLTTVGFNPIQPGPTLRHLASSGRDFYYVSIGREAIERVNKKMSTPFLTVPLPPGSLPGQKEPLELFGDVDQKTAHPSFPEELAYELTKAMLKNAPKVGQYFAFGELWTKPDLFVLGLNEKNTHLGAMRALKEAGIWERRRDSL